ncbi:MAG: hypothetical protein ACMUHY_08805, partial [Thermoplasmatota archaeon]
MRIGIILYSQTGNTLSVAERIRDRLTKKGHTVKIDKVLIKGNHDIFKLTDYTKYFRDIRGYHVMNGLILSHIPISKDSLA